MKQIKMLRNLISSMDVSEGATFVGSNNLNPLIFGHLCVPRSTAIDENTDCFITIGVANSMNALRE
jgi:hypothetical protein